MTATVALLAFLSSVLGGAIGAGVVAWLAYIRTRRERVWTDRYEALRNILLTLETITSHFGVEYMEERGLSVISHHERQQLQKDWPTANRALKRHVSSLQLLFKEREITPLMELVANMYGAFFNLYQEVDHEAAAGHYDTISNQAISATKEVIRLAQKYCV